MRMNAMAAGLVVAAGTIGAVGGMVGAVMGQGVGPGAPYRVATVDGGGEEVSPRGHSFTAWGARVAVAYRGAKGGAVSAYDPRTGAFEEIVNGLERSPEGPELLGTAGGRMVFAAQRPGAGHELMAIGEDGSVTRLSGLSGESVFAGPWASAGGRLLVYTWDYATFEMRIWETDGTAEGTRALELGQDIAVAAWGIGSRVIYAGVYGELLAYDVLSGAREVLLASRDYGPQGMWIRDGRGVFMRGELVYETDGTAAGTRSLATPRRGVYAPVTPVGTRLAYQMNEGVVSVERGGGDMQRLVEGSGLIVQRCGPALVISRGTDTDLEVWLSDGTSAGTERWFSRSGTWPSVTTLGDGRTAGFVQISSWNGEQEFFRTDGTVGGTERMPVALGSQFPDVVEGALYFGLAPVELGETGMYTIGERGSARRIADPRWTQAVGFGEAEGMFGGAGRGWMARRRADGGRSLWSTNGAAGDLVESPCLVCGGNEYVQWEAAPRGMTALVSDVDGIRRLVAMGEAGDEVLTLRVMSERWVSAASGPSGVAAYDRRTVVVTDGTAAGTLTFDVAAPEEAAAEVISVGSWFAVVATWKDDENRRMGQAWSVNAGGVRDLGAIEAWSTPGVFADRLYWTTRDGDLMMSDGVGPLAVVGRGEAPRVHGEWRGRGIVAEWDGEAGESVIKLVDPADVAFASMVEVGRVGAWVRASYGVGDRIVAVAGNQLEDLVAVDPMTGRAESLGFEAAWVTGRTVLGGREVLTVTEAGEGREAFWLTDGTAAGTRVVPAGREPIARLQGLRGGSVVGGRLCVISAVHDGPQVFAVNLCAADQNGDGMWTDEDYTAFTLGFEAGASSADVNADGFVDMFDYMDYLTAMEMGC